MMYPWDASRVYPNAESKVEMRCTKCGHREPVKQGGGADAGEARGAKGT
jgi:hypothetical protein